MKIVWGNKNRKKMGINVLIKMEITAKMIVCRKIKTYTQIKTKKHVKMKTKTSIKTQSNTKIQIKMWMQIRRTDHIHLYRIKPEQSTSQFIECRKKRKLLSFDD